MPAAKTLAMTFRVCVFALFSCLIALPAAAATPQTWNIDPVHSTAQFTARHFGIVPVIGTIPILSASVQLNQGSEIPIAVRAQLDASKVDTHDDMRDGDLKSPHFFDVAHWPTISFVSTKVVGSDPAHFTIDGNLTMHGQTHPVALNAQVVGAGKTPRGHSLIAYAATATIDRTQWGMTYGPLIVGNAIELSINAEAYAP
jgi:polyisoprenoid-binding protein YceI